MSRVKQRSRKSGGLENPVRTSTAPARRTRSQTRYNGAVQRKAAAKGRASEPQTLSAANDGVAAASAPLPYRSSIQAAFGPFDISDVRTQTGGAAKAASDSMGASAYAVGDRIGFGEAPSLHTAAHEAAHVVQQRGGVSLKGDVGESGDVYEQHADRVADLVVDGKSAAAELRKMSGGGLATTAVQRFDSPHHIGVGDSVEGESIEVNGVVFTPGELNALVDYVGPLDVFQEAYSDPGLHNIVREMHHLLTIGCEDTLKWDRLTGGAYSALSQDNEDHFAPGGTEFDGRNFIVTFATNYSAALKEGAGNASAEQVEKARLLLYTAEHYLEDAFSAGHMVVSVDIENAVDSVLTTGVIDLVAMSRLIALDVYNNSGSVLQDYAVVYGLGKPQPITQQLFVTLATSAGVLLNVASPKSIYDSIRKFVHEDVEAGVEVTSMAYPAPFVLRGDHDLSHDKSPQAVVALQAALVDVRDVFESNLGSPVADPDSRAAELIKFHSPTPTGDGQKVVADALATATASRADLMKAITAATVGTLGGVMDNLVYISETSPLGLIGRIVRLNDPQSPHDRPDLLPPPQGLPKAPESAEE